MKIIRTRFTFESGNVFIQFVLKDTDQNKILDFIIKTKAKINYVSKSNYTNSDQYELVIENISFRKASDIYNDHYKPFLKRHNYGENEND